MLNEKNIKPCSYARISVDMDEARDENASIENQKQINTSYIKKNFPLAKFDEEKDTFTDRDKSGYTFSSIFFTPGTLSLCTINRLDTFNPVMSGAHCNANWFSIFSKSIPCTISNTSCDIQSPF